MISGMDDLSSAGNYKSSIGLDILLYMNPRGLIFSTSKIQQEKSLMQKFSEKFHIRLTQL